MGFSAKQIEQLLRPVNPKRVQRDDKGNSHLAAYDVSAHLTRIFGFGGWEKRITSLELVCEREAKDPKRDRMGWHVTYRCQMTLLVKDPAGVVAWSGDDGATGSASNLPDRGDAHDFAMKNAISYALKRCAKDLGDQFGLSLYNKGSLKAVVGAVLTTGDEKDVESALPDEMHPDAEEHGGPAEDAPAGEHQPPAPDDPMFGDWAAAIDAITSQADAGKVLEEVERKNRGGILANAPAAAIRGAVKDKLATLGNGHRQQPARPSRPAGPPATERGATAVPTGGGDDGDWVTGFTERVRQTTEPGRLAPLAAQIGNAVRSRKITPAKSAELSALVQERRRELEQVPA